MEPARRFLNHFPLVAAWRPGRVARSDGPAACCVTTLSYLVILTYVSYTFAYSPVPYTHLPLHSHGWLWLLTLGLSDSPR